MQAALAIGKGSFLKQEQMAKLNNTPWIPSGTLGDLVFCSGKVRKPYVRIKPTKQKERSPAQELNSLKLKMTTLLLAPFKELINEVWKERSGKTVPYDSARSYFYHHCFKVEEERLQISYTDIQLSKGTLTAPANFVAILEGKELKIQWQVEKTRKAADFNSVYLAIYNESTNTSMYLKSSALQIAGQLITEIPEGFLSCTLHAFIIFLSPDRKNASPTRYIKLT